MNEENIKKAYKYLSNKYPTAPAMLPEIIKKDIVDKFELEDEEVYIVYYNWKRNVLKIKEKPRFKDINKRKEICEEDKYFFRWMNNLEKLKELHKRYKMNVDIDELAKEVKISKSALQCAFSRYRKLGILYGNKKGNTNCIIISGRKFSEEEVKEIILNINKGKEKVRDLAKKMKVDESRLRNVYNYYKNQFI